MLASDAGLQDVLGAELLQGRFPGRWYVAHTRSRAEKILAKELGRLGIRNYLPLMERTTRSPATRRLSKSIVPVFPGYVFFLGTDQERYRALTTNRIARVLEVPNQKQLVSELIGIQTLLANEQAFQVDSGLAVGKWGRITDGPLQGLEGIITRAEPLWRLTMNVTILGQSVHVEVDGSRVEPIDPPSHGQDAG